LKVDRGKSTNGKEPSRTRKESLKGSTGSKAMGANTKQMGEGKVLGTGNEKRILQWVWTLFKAPWE